MITRRNGSDTDCRREVFGSISYRHQNVKQADRAGTLHPISIRFTACQASLQVRQRAQFVGDLGIDPDSGSHRARSQRPPAVGVEQHAQVIGCFGLDFDQIPCSRSDSLLQLTNMAAAASVEPFPPSISYRAEMMSLRRPVQR